MIDYLLSPGFKSHLENVYYISGVVLSAGLMIGIWQILQQRQLSRTASKREAFKIAAERCEFFGSNILPGAVALKERFKDTGVEFLNKCKVETSEEGIWMNCDELRKEDSIAVNKFTGEITRLLNSLEGFALFFVTGVADDNVGFLTCGKAFTLFFEEFFPFYVLSGNLDDGAKATQALYTAWKERLRQLELAKQKALIEAKLDTSKLKAKKPIGA